MRIQHNITALNAANRLKANEATVSKNIQKLSSGYRINSAADDAAGLAVSEKMRKQINGLSQAEDNTQNGISLIQTAEGGLNETSAILQRMNTLAVEASNGTYKDNDRANLQLEINSLNTEVNRISTSTKFNEISLLDGSLSSTGVNNATNAVVMVNGSALTPTASTAVAGSYKLGATLASTDAQVTAGTSHTFDITYKDATGATQSTKITLTVDSTATHIVGSNGSSTLGSTASTNIVQAADWDTALRDTINYDPTLSKAFTSSIATDVTLTANTKGSSGEQVLSVAQDGTTLAGTVTAGTDAYSSFDFASHYSVYDGTSATADKSVFSVNGQRFAFVKNGLTDATALGSDVNIVTIAASASPTTVASADTTAMSALINQKTGLSTVQDATVTAIDFKAGAASGSGNALVFQVGAENSDDQRATLSIDSMNAASLGLTAIDISNQTGAQAAIDIISKASATVSTTRAQLGALQNELEHTANNLGTMSENLTSAESTIRDVDMTDEYVQYSKNQILSQAANAMLAQANTQPQNVLSLLKG